MCGDRLLFMNMECLRKLKVFMIKRMLYVMSLYFQIQFLMRNKDII